VGALAKDLGHFTHFERIDFGLLPTPWPGMSASTADHRRGRDGCAAFVEWLRSRHEALVAVVCHHNVIQSLLAGVYWDRIRNAEPILCTFDGAAFRHHTDGAAFFGTDLGLGLQAAPASSSASVRLDCGGGYVAVVRREARALRRELLRREGRKRRKQMQRAAGCALALRRVSDGAAAPLVEGADFSWLRDGDVVELVELQVTATAAATAAEEEEEERGAENATAGAAAGVGEGAGGGGGVAGDVSLLPV